MQQGPIVACILSRDEPELLRENLEHLIYREGIEHVVITNHVSIEANKAVLADYAPYVYRQFDHIQPTPYPQNKWRTDMVRWAIKELKATWLVCTDTDEFWYGLKELKSLGPKVRSVVVNNVIEHYGTQIDPAKGFSVYNMPWYWGTHRDIGKTIHRGDGARLNIVRCSHFPVQGGFVQRDLPGLCMHHYSVRDWERFLIKVHTANEGNPPNRRRTLWRQLDKAGTLYEHWKERYTPDKETLMAKVETGEAGYFMPPPIQRSKSNEDQTLRTVT